MSGLRSVVNRDRSRIRPERIPINNGMNLLSGWLDKFRTFRLGNAVLSQWKHGAFTVLIPVNHTHTHTHTHTKGPHCWEILIVLIVGFADIKYRPLGLDSGRASVASRR